MPHGRVEIPQRRSDVDWAPFGQRDEMDVGVNAVDRGAHLGVITRLEPEPERAIVLLPVRIDDYTSRQCQTQRVRRKHVQANRNGIEPEALAELQVELGEPARGADVVYDKGVLADPKRGKPCLSLVRPDQPKRPCRTECRVEPVGAECRHWPIEQREPWSARVEGKPLTTGTRTDRRHSR